VLPFVVGSYPSPLGVTLRRWVSAFVVGCRPSSLGVNPSSLGVRLRRWVFVLSLGFTLLRWVLPFVVGCQPSSLGVNPSSLGFRLASLGVRASSLGFHLAWLALSLPVLGSSCSHVGGWRCVGLGIMRVDWMGGCMAKTNHDDNRRGSLFVTYCTGLPYPGSPLVFIRPRFPRRANMSRPNPFGKGGAATLPSSLLRMNDLFF
jgi:hypothetical protein